MAVTGSGISSSLFRCVDGAGSLLSSRKQSMFAFILFQVEEAKYILQEPEAQIKGFQAQWERHLLIITL